MYSELEYGKGKGGVILGCTILFTGARKRNIITNDHRDTSMPIHLQYFYVYKSLQL